VFVDRRSKDQINQKVVGESESNENEDELNIKLKNRSNLPLIDAGAIEIVTIHAQIAGTHKAGVKPLQNTPIHIRYKRYKTRISIQEMNVQSEAWRCDRCSWPNVEFAPKCRRPARC
jgi:hypothetical protein